MSITHSISRNISRSSPYLHLVLIYDIQQRQAEYQSKANSSNGANIFHQSIDICFFMPIAAIQVIRNVYCFVISNVIIPDNSITAEIKISFREYFLVLIPIRTPISPTTMIILYITLELFNPMPLQKTLAITNAKYI